MEQVTADLLNGSDVFTETADNNNDSSKTVSFISLKPQIVIGGSKAADAISFYKSAFGAEELKRDLHPKRKAEQELPIILSAELKIGSSVFQVCDQVDGSVAPVQGSGYTFCLETNDVDGAVKNAVSAGGILDGGEIVEGENACCGSRVAKINDGYGNVFLICCNGKKVIDVDA